MKLIFMGTPDFAVPSLRSLIDNHFSLLGAFTQPDKPVGRKQVITSPPVKLLAQEAGIPVYQPGSIRNAKDQFESLFKEADLAVVAAYGKILPEWMLSAPKFGCVNIHSSLLPKYRGAAPINWAIVNGDTVTGVTTMQMDAGLDTGDILLQRSLQIGSDERTPELTGRLAALGAELLIETIEQIASGTAQRIPQDNSIASYAPILKREDGLINWELSATRIRNQMRGFTPFPGCYTVVREQKLEIVEMSAEPAPAVLEAGTITEIGRDYFLVACGEASQARILSVQASGKKAMAVRDYLNGSRLVVGERLG